ncbi:hypothetical protein [Capnocytophaga sp.]|uniref:hypothetical protein n=1 Tax=Capnocytophaga sp. TaxID=44737 RepID=UPI0026DBE847|nr:hypothetical protein [Capnocytophaga sp.]MDO5106239.1 hypothetical protein [Capnocytophaga sp.]
MITNKQIKTIQTIFSSEKKLDRDERLAYISGFFQQDIKSLKDLTKIQAIHLTRHLNGEETKQFQFYAYFDANNPQHKALLARCHELGWVQDDKPHLVDLNCLGGWLISKRSPVKKALLDMSHKEVSKIIFAIENMIKSKYK